MLTAEAAACAMTAGEVTATLAGARLPLCRQVPTPWSHRRLVPSRRPVPNRLRLIPATAVQRAWMTSQSSPRACRRAGLTIYTIGLGADVNPDLLVDVAGDRARYTAAPEAEELERIYSRLAPVLPCPAGRHDWGKPWP